MTQDTSRDIIPCRRFIRLKPLIDTICIVHGIPVPCSSYSRVPCMPVQNDVNNRSFAIARSPGTMTMMIRTVMYMIQCKNYLIY